MASIAKNMPIVKKLLTGSGIAGGFASGYYLYHKFNGDKLPASILSIQPAVSRTIVTSTDKTGLGLRLYQYQTCPFCSKVRAFLDYYGFSYEVVEVNPVTRKQIKSSNYRKVPIVIAQGAGYKQLNDSSLTISILRTLMLNYSKGLDGALENYMTVSVADPAKPDSLKDDIPNKYFVMTEVSEANTIDKLRDEREWREWADKKLVHTLSPNVYRTFGEALQSFRWFSQVGEWERNFPNWERVMVIYVGATAMYWIGKRLKKRHALKDDVRESLYDSCNLWMRSIGKYRKFMGGDMPCLADLAVYGTLSAIEGCQAFQDLLEHTQIWTLVFFDERSRRATLGKCGIETLYFKSQRLGQEDFVPVGVFLIRLLFASTKVRPKRARIFIYINTYICSSICCI